MDIVADSDRCVFENITHIWGGKTSRHIAPGKGIRHTHSAPNLDVMQLRACDRSAREGSMDVRSVRVARHWPFNVH